MAGLVLAAGPGTRFGGPKAVAELDGERLVDRAVRTLRAGGADPVYAVAGAADLGTVDAVVVPSPDWAEGMGASLRAALTELETAPVDVEAVVVTLVDQPGLTAAAVRRLIEAVDGRGSVAVASYDGRQGHPVALGRAHWAEVGAAAAGDSGARAFLRTHADRVVHVECADVATDADVDTKEQLARFRRS